MDIAVCMHVASEGPGTLGTFLESKGARLVYFPLFDGASVPSEPDRFSAVVSMGGPMNVYDDLPWIEPEDRFLRKAIEADIPVIGVCLGAQLIAKACGAKVTRSPSEEIGWDKISLSAAGQDEPLFAGLPEEMEVFQWHGDMFGIPDGGKLLASSTGCPHQALRYRNALGLQFHVEVTPEILSEWFADDPRLDGILARYKEIGPVLDSLATRLFTNFFDLVKAR
ncbi:MAG: type 1 glutamine amidotransferase [Thermodesulfobacteriota bacterium]